MRSPQLYWVNFFRGAKTCMMIVEVKSGFRNCLICSMERPSKKRAILSSSDQWDSQNWRKCQSKQQQGIIHNRRRHWKACSLVRGDQKKQRQNERKSEEKNGKTKTNNTFGFKIDYSPSNKFDSAWNSIMKCRLSSDLPPSTVMNTGSLQGVASVQRPHFVDLDLVFCTALPNSA